MIDTCTPWHVLWELLFVCIVVYECFSPFRFACTFFIVGLFFYTVYFTHFYINPPKGAFWCRSCFSYVNLFFLCEWHTRVLSGTKGSASQASDGVSPVQSVVDTRFLCVSVCACGVFVCVCAFVCVGLVGKWRRLCHTASWERSWKKAKT